MRGLVGRGGRTDEDAPILVVRIWEYDFVRGSAPGLDIR